jgi:hypothetical protein
LYCARSVPQQTGQVDHFIPWAKYPVDLGHNFVLAHASCNAAKADHVAAVAHLTAWTERNRRHQASLAAEFRGHGVLHDLSMSVRIAQWAYQHTFTAGGLTWWRQQELIPLPPDWQHALLPLLDLREGCSV